MKNFYNILTLILMAECTVLTSISSKAALYEETYLDPYNMEDDFISPEDNDGEVTFEFIDTDQSPAFPYYAKMGREHPVLEIYPTENYNALIDSANVVLAIFPEDLLSLTERSKAYYQLGQTEKSLQDALAIYGRYNADLFPSSLVDALSETEPQTVKKYLAQYTDEYLRNPQPSKADRSQIYYLLCLSAVEKNLGNMARAYEIARIASKIDPEDDSAPIMMSTLLLQNGQPDKAKKVLAPFVKHMEDTSSAAFHNYILALRDNGQSKEAFKLLDKMLKRNPGISYRRSCLYDYACLLVATGQYPESLEMLDTFIEELEEYYQDEKDLVRTSLLPELYLRRAIVYTILADRAEEGFGKIGLQINAMGDIDKVLSYTDGDNYTGLEATAYAWLDEKEEALKWIEKYKTLNPNCQESWIYAILGDNKEALRLLKQEFDDHSTSPVQIDNDPNYIRLRGTTEYQKLAKAYKPLPMK